MSKKKSKVKLDWSNKRIHGAAVLAFSLFNAIAAEHGEEVAKEIFDTTGFCVRRLPKSEQAEMKGWLILARLDSMKSKNVALLARALRAEGFGTMESSVEKYIRELVQKRKRLMADGSWPAGAPLPDQNDYQLPPGVIV
jgi:hypothetical protein